MQYFNKEKAQVPYALVKEEGGYLKPSGYILKKIKENAIDFSMFFNFEGEFGKYRGFVNLKDNVYNFLKKNIKSNWWRVLGYKLEEEPFIKVGKWKEGKKEVNYTYKIEDVRLDLKKAKILKGILQALNNEIEPPVALEHIIDIIKENINPSDLKGKVEGEFIFNDEHGLIIDLERDKNNRSGDTASFLWRYFNNNTNDFVEFIENQLGIVIDEDVISEIFFEYNIDDNLTISFRKNGVFLIQSAGKTEVEQPIIHRGVKLLGTLKTNYDIKQRMFTDQSIEYFVVDVEEVGKQIISYRGERTAFNNMYGGLGLRVVGGGKSYQYFWDGLEQWRKQKKKEMKEFKLITKNGYFPEDGLVVHGGEILAYNGDITELVNYAQKYAINKELKEENDLQKVGQIMKDIYQKPYRLIVYLWFIGAWHKYTLQKYGIKVPLLLLSGLRSSGKTDSIETVMKLFNYELNEKNGIQPRVLNIASTTPQPLLFALTEGTPIFLDEYRQSKFESKLNEILKAVFNGQPIQKGALQYRNLEFKMESPVAIAGEKLPQQPSVVSRSIYLPFRPQDKIDVKQYTELKKQLEGISVLKAALELDFNDKDIYQPVEFEGLDGRLQNSLNYLIYVNRVAQIIPEEELVNYLNDIGDYMKRYMASTDELRIFFNKLCKDNVKNKYYSFEQTNDGNIILHLYVDRDESLEYQQYIAMIKDMVDDKEELGDDIAIDLKYILQNNKKEAEWIVKSIMRFFKAVRDPAWVNYIDELLGVEI